MRRGQETSKVQRSVTVPCWQILGWWHIQFSKLFPRTFYCLFKQCAILRIPSKTRPSLKEIPMSHYLGLRCRKSTFSSPVRSTVQYSFKWCLPASWLRPKLRKRVWGGGREGSIERFTLPSLPSPHASCPRASGTGRNVKTETLWALVNREAP